MIYAVQPGPPGAEAALPLKDIHMPASPALWPPAPGWWVLTLLILALLGWAGFQLYRYWQRRKFQREVLDVLDGLQRPRAEEQLPRLFADISILLRRVAMMKYPRKEVAELTGSRWTDFLDLHGGDGEYTNGVGRVLAEGPYARFADPGEVDVDALLSLARQWIKRNTG
jgi:hypothetical protein